MTLIHRRDDCDSATDAEERARLRYEARVASGGGARRCVVSVEVPSSRSRVETVMSRSKRASGAQEGEGELARPQRGGARSAFGEGRRSWAQYIIAL